MITEIRERIANSVTRRLIRPHRFVGQLLWQLVQAGRFTHHWYPDWHEAGCPGSRGNETPCNNAYCRVDIRRRTMEMDAGGRFYRRVHLLVWLAGVRWYFFWLYRSYAWTRLYENVERFLAPSLYAEEEA